MTDLVSEMGRERSMRYGITSLIFSGMARCKNGSRVSYRLSSSGAEIPAARSAPNSCVIEAISDLETDAVSASVSKFETLNVSGGV